AQTRFARTALIAIVLATVLAGLLCAIGSAYTISRPIIAATRSTQQLASGDYGIEISGVDRQDEIGQMARSLTIFRDSLIDGERVRREREERERLGRRRQHIGE